MSTFISIEDGMFEVSVTNHNVKPAHKVIGFAGLEDDAKLALLLLKANRRDVDAGAIFGTSSVDFPHEYGVPEEVSARDLNVTIIGAVLKLEKEIGE